MEQRTRKRFEGITNIIRFNWHFYVIALAAAVVLLVAKQLFSGIATIMLAILLLLVFSIVTSLAVSFYVYDWSHLYTLRWLNSLHIPDGSQIANINAGFDETSYLLANKYPGAKLAVFDFYDPEKHTEISIKRARKRYAAYQNTIAITTSHLPLENESVDYFFAILSAHEIRNEEERIYFFKQVKNALKRDGQVIVAEHIRNTSNFIAYNIGFFHFFSKSVWKHTFGKAGLRITNEATVTPFIHVFFLQKNESAS